MYEGARGAPASGSLIAGEPSSLRFKVELLGDYADETSVLQVSFAITLAHAKAEAIALQEESDDIDGFQIRDLDHSARIVWTEKRYR